MGRAPRIIEPDAVYHVFSRGSNRLAIFFDDLDYFENLELLGSAVRRYAWRLYAYCLMPNHLHVLVRVPECGLSEGMRDYNGGFLRRTSARYGRIAHLFHNRFGLKKVSDDDQLVHTARYVVMNPVRAGICQHPKHWRWSSFRGTAGLQPAQEWLDAAGLLTHFDQFEPGNALTAYRRFVEGALPEVSDTVTEV